MREYLVTGTNDAGIRQTRRIEADSEEAACVTMETLGFSDVAICTDKWSAERRYYLTGTDRAGARETCQVRAETAKAAYADAVSRGYSDIVLHTDDIEASMVADASPSKGIMLEDFLSPKDHLAVRSRGPWRRFLYVTKVIYTKMWWVTAILVCIGFVGEWSTGSFYFFFWMMAIAVGIPPIIAAMFTLNAPSQYYMQHLEASVWGRWPVVLETADSLRGHVPDFDLDFRCAVAYAGMGDLNRGLSLVERYVKSDDIAPSMYWCRCSSIYYNAHLYEKVLECARKAYEAEPEEPAMGLDLAIWLLEVEKDLEQARRLIESVAQMHHGDIVSMGLIYARGLLALNSKELKNAELQFRNSEEKHQAMAGGNPIIGWRADRSRAYRAIAVAKMRRRDEALSLFEPVFRRFESLEDDLLLSRFKRALAS